MSEHNQKAVQADPGSSLWHFDKRINIATVAAVISIGVAGVTAWIGHSNRIAVLETRQVEMGRAISDAKNDAKNDRDAFHAAVKEVNQSIRHLRDEIRSELLEIRRARQEAHR